MFPSYNPIMNTFTSIQSLWLHRGGQNRHLAAERQPASNYFQYQWPSIKALHCYCTVWGVGLQSCTPAVQDIHPQQTTRPRLPGECHQHVMRWETLYRSSIILHEFAGTRCTCKCRCNLHVHLYLVPNLVVLVWIYMCSAYTSCTLITIIITL